MSGQDISSQFGSSQIKKRQVKSSWDRSNQVMTDLKFFDSKFFGWKIFWPQHFFWLKVYGCKIFWAKNLFLTQNALENGVWLWRWPNLSYYNIISYYNFRTFSDGNFKNFKTNQFQNQLLHFKIKVILVRLYYYIFENNLNKMEYILNKISNIPWDPLL